MSERAREPEFYAKATLGFRKWYFSPGAGEESPLLRGLANPLLQGLAKRGFDSPRHRWRLSTPNHAGCSRLEHAPDSRYAAHGEVPGTNCSCGFYAYGRRIGSNSETGIHVVGGVIAGWGNLELHERGFRCATAKILALFEPVPDKDHADHDSADCKERDVLSRLCTDYDGAARKNREALKRMCSDHAIPLLEPDALMDEEDLRRYAAERDLALLEDQLRPAQSYRPAFEDIEGEEELAS